MGRFILGRYSTYYILLHLLTSYYILLLDINYLLMAWNVLHGSVQASFCQAANSPNGPVRM